MSEAKETILGRIRKALGDISENEQPGNVAVPREYRQKGELADDEIVTLFAERVGEYKAAVKRIENNKLEAAIAEALNGQDVKRLVVPPGFPAEWLPASVESLHDKPEAPLTNHQLDASGGVITTCALAVAHTGTIILDAGQGQGRRVLTLLPDYHLCIVREEQIVELLPEAIMHFEQQVKKDGPPLTFISGPSATSDIELSRVEGVHGPRRLEVLIVR